MRRNRKLLTLSLILPVALLCQEKNRPAIDMITVNAGPSEPPLSPATCTESSYGYLHIGERTDLTPEEIGRYIEADSSDGKVLTVYPKSKTGIFVYAECKSKASR